MEIDKKLYEEIKAYCDLNGIKPKEYINTLLKKAFMEDKYGKHPFQTQKDPQTGDVIVHNISDAVIEAKMREILNSMASGDGKYAEFVGKVGEENNKKVVDERIYGDDGAKNDDSSAPEAIRDTDRDNVPRNEETETKNGEFPDKTETNTEESRQAASNVARKPKKRVINVK